MSKQFPTYKQFRFLVRQRIKADYPGSEREAVEMCVDMQARIENWLKYLAGQINSKGRPPLNVLDTLTPEQLYTLKKLYVNRGWLDWYIPVRYRVERKHDDRTIHIYVRRAEKNRLIGKRLVEYWGSTVKHPTCRSAAESVQPDTLGPAGVIANKGDYVFARFDRGTK